MKLYEIGEQMEAIEAEIDLYASEHEGEILAELEDALMALAEDRTSKLLGIAVWIKNLRAEENAYKEETDSLRKKREAVQKKIDRLTGFIDTQIGPEESIKDSRVSIFHRRSEVVVVENQALLPGNCTRIVVEPRKDEIKRLIKAGEIVPGAQIETRNNLQ